ncbi:heavy-metal-associated domain-containing protein [Neobacillus muris]|uniref:heavy-metal-associated domain-containing protein n=1 Tax=Neobacillus muris TaxID=2941334 RepID=UPI00203EF780|nr:heavy metal-associated domain-containing protein [Neobacillus muris]
MQKGSLKVEGMNSQTDANKVLHALNEVWGVREAEVNLSRSEAVFSFNEQAASYQDFEQAIIDLGYQIVRQ